MDPVKIKQLFIKCISFNGHVQLVCPVTLYSFARPSHSLINSQWPLWQCGQDHWWICSIWDFVGNIRLSGGGTPAVWMVMSMRKCVYPAHCLCACSHGTCVMCEFWGMATERWTHRLSQGHHLTWLHVCLCKTVCVSAVGWQWEEGSLIRALIKKQRVYWINPVVINRAHSKQPPPLQLLWSHCDDVAVTMD